MQPIHSHRGPQDDQQIVGQSQTQFRWSRRSQATTIDPSHPARTLGGMFLSRSSDLALPKDKTITIVVISGRSRGLLHRLIKPLASVGRIGGGADVEIDDPEASDLHCAVGVNGDLVRLCDLGSGNGTYVNGERVRTAGLNHLSEFRVGSSLLLVTILPKRETDNE